MNNIINNFLLDANQMGLWVSPDFSQLMLCRMLDYRYITHTYNNRVFPIQLLNISVLIKDWIADNNFKCVEEWLAESKTEFCKYRKKSYCLAPIGIICKLLYIL